MFRAGDTFDRYRIEEALGEGGMGIVYQAYDTRLHRRVALKVVRPEVAREEDGTTASEATQRLMREGKAASTLNHPNAVAVLDVGEFEGVPFLAMELVRGRPLHHFLGDARVPLAQRLEWLADIAYGLGAAHARGLVHRDVKPENVMICDDGTVKVLDFGVAKQVGPQPKPVNRTGRDGLPSDAFVTRTGIVLGTPMYMAPEQILDEPLDGRSDQYAWASLAYELLSGGTHPATTNNPRNLPVQFAIVQEVPLPLYEVAPEIPPQINAIIMRALSKSASDRYATMDEIAFELERCARGLDAEADEVSATQRLPALNAPEAKALLHAPADGAARERAQLDIDVDPESMADTLALRVPPPPPVANAHQEPVTEASPRERSATAPLPILSHARAERSGAGWPVLVGWVVAIVLALATAALLYVLYVRR